MDLHLLRFLDVPAGATPRYLELDRSNPEAKASFARKTRETVRHAFGRDTGDDIKETWRARL
ncbi:MAG: hypothetical protein ACLQKK_00625 [Rhodomicrobium sp.]